MAGNGLTKARRVEQNLTWMDQAACRGKDPNIFFPPKWDRSAGDQARAICADCPVLDRCLAYAVTLPANEPGIYAGLSQRERQRRAGWRKTR